MSYYGLIILFLYITTFFILYFYRYVNKAISTFMAYAVSLFAFIVASLRPDHFPDVDTYELMFEFASIGNFEDSLYWLSHGEPGFKIFSFIFSKITLDYRFYLLTLALSSYMLLIIASRIAGVKFVYVWFFYLSTFFITRDLGVIRLSIASHLIVIALSQKRILSSISTLALSSLSFQYYSIISILPIYISKFKINYIWIFLFIMVCFALTPYINLEIMSIFALEKQLDNYNLSESSGTGLQSVIIPTVRNLLFAIIVFLLYRGTKIERVQKIWMISLFLSILSYVFFHNFLILAQRFSAYFGAILPFALAWICDKQNHRNNLKFNLTTIFFVINFISLFYYNDFVWLE